MARRLPGIELVSVDSMQVYVGMDVGTAKPSAAERAEVPHHLLDLADPSEQFTVTRFQAAAEAAIAAIEARGHRALLVGGTGLYLQAVVDRLSVPGQWPRVRAELEDEAAALGGEAGSPDAAPALHRRLAEADPAAAARIEPGNLRRIVRALEVTLGSGRPFSSFGPGIDAYPPTRFRMAGVWLPRGVVNARIEARLTEQMDAGFLDEVATLAARSQKGMWWPVPHRPPGAWATGNCSGTSTGSPRSPRRLKRLSGARAPSPAASGCGSAGTHGSPGWRPREIRSICCPPS